MLINRIPVPGTASAAGLVSRSLPPDEFRPTLADIDPVDLSESGQRARAEVVRDLRVREAQRRGDERPIAPPLPGGLRALGRRILSFAGFVAAWHRRARMCDQLMALDDHALKDIGLTRDDIADVVRAGGRIRREASRAPGIGASRSTAACG